MNWGLWHTWHWKISTQGNYFRDFKKARTQVVYILISYRACIRKGKNSRKNIEIPLIYFASEEIQSGKIQIFPNLIHFLQDFPAQKVLYPIMLFCMNSTIYIYFIFLNSTHICVQVSTKFIDFGTLEIWGRIVNNALFRNKEIYAWWNVPAKLFKISLILLRIRNSGIFKYIGLFSISWFYTFVVL